MKTYEELESENQVLEATLERQRLRLNEWVALRTECLTELNDTRAELEKTQQKLARVKSKTCKDCTKLFEEMAEKQLESRSCKTCAHDKCGQCVEIAIYWQGDCDSAKVNYCSLWRAKK